MSTKPVKQFRIVRGQPTQVEDTVNELLKSDDGWDLNGETFVMDIQGVDITVQAMVQYSV